MSENKQHSALGQSGLIAFSPAEARTRFPGHHVDCFCGARSTVIAYIIANDVHHYRLRCLARQQLSRTSLPQRLLDYTVIAQAPAVRSASAAEPGFLCEHCGAAGVETHHWVPRSLFHDYNAWPAAQLCPACHALWHDVMRADAGRL